MLAIRFRTDRDREDARGFVRAIDDDPYDEVTRRVFADWLEERGYDDEAAIQRSWTAQAHQEATDVVRDWCGSNLYDEDEDGVVGKLFGWMTRYLDGVSYYASVYGSAPDTPDWDVWRAYMLLTGRPVADDEWGDFYISCSC